MINYCVCRLIKNSFIILIFLIVFNLIKTPFILAQDCEGLLVKIKTKDINGDEFKGELILEVSNRLKETVFVAMSPYFCYSNSDSLIYYLIPNGRDFCPNEIAFFKRNSVIIPFDVVSNLTFLKFPQIIKFIPGSHSFFIIHINKEGLMVLKDVIWSINYDYRYALKSDIDLDFAKLPEAIKEEFSNSIFYKDTVKIDLLLKNDFSIDSLLYVTKNGNDYPYDYKSIYDSMLKHFWHKSIFVF